MKRLKYAPIPEPFTGATANWRRCSILKKKGARCRDPQPQNHSAQGKHANGAHATCLIPIDQREHPFLLSLIDVPFFGCNSSTAAALDKPDLATPPAAPSGHGGQRSGSGRKSSKMHRGRKKRRAGRPASTSRKAALRIIGDEVGDLVGVKTGQFVTRDRCMEILRAVRSAIGELSESSGDGLWKRQYAVESIVKGRCSCGSGIVRRAIKALRAGTKDSIADFVLNEVTVRKTDRTHIRKLSPRLLSVLDKAIQAELIDPINPSRVGVTVDAVRELIRNTCDADVSRRTAWKALLSLGYDYCKLTRKVRFTSKRRKRIETFIREYASAVERESRGEVVIVYMDESYVHAQHKSTHGWDIKSDLSEQINDCCVQQEEGAVREGEIAGGKGTRHVFLCGLSKDGIVKDPLMDAATLRLSTYESTLNEEHRASTWVFQAKKKGIPDYHDNMDSYMFIKWVETR